MNTERDSPSEEMNIIYLAFCWGDTYSVIGGIIFCITHGCLIVHVPSHWWCCQPKSWKAILDTGIMTHEKWIFDNLRWLYYRCQTWEMII
jgi:hypothetical protein